MCALETLFRQSSGVLALNSVLKIILYSHGVSLSRQKHETRIGVDR